MCRIEIVRPIQPKPYLGGLKDLKTNLIYHHAFAQTNQKVREHRTKYHREVLFVIFFDNLVTNL